MIATINAFLQATKEPDLENFQPQCYFTSLHSTRPIMGSKVKWKPDLVLIHLIDGCLRQGTLHWHNIQTLVKHTCEPKPLMWMPETVLSKSYQIFCSQPKRDFIITLCITAKGFHIVVADHSGMVKTDVIKITQYTSSVFVRVFGISIFCPSLHMYPSWWSLQHYSRPSPLWANGQRASFSHEALAHCEHFFCSWTPEIQSHVLPLRRGYPSTHISSLQTPQAVSQSPVGCVASTANYCSCCWQEW